MPFEHSAQDGWLRTFLALRFDRQEVAARDAAFFTQLVCTSGDFPCMNWTGI
jgi:hypothetical protein